MNNIITLNQRIDKPTIDAAVVNSESLVIEYTNPYLNGSMVEVDIAALTSTQRTKISDAIDVLTFPAEEDAFVFKIAKDGGDFDLAGCYVRDAESTSGTLTDLPNATPLIMKVEVAGFTSNPYREVVVYYDAEFNPDDVELLKEIDVDLTGDGLNFTLVPTNECRVSFRKPDAATETYVIVYNQYNEVI